MKKDLKQKGSAHYMITCATVKKDFLLKKNVIISFLNILNHRKLPLKINDFILSID